MIENDYPIPSYMADVFEKPDGWVEPPQPVSDSILVLPDDKQRSRVYAIDCERSRLNRGSRAGRCRLIRWPWRWHDPEDNLTRYSAIPIRPPGPSIASVGALVGSYCPVVADSRHMHSCCYHGRY